MNKVVIPEIQDEYVCIKAITQSQIESSRFQKVKQLNEERMDIDSLKEAAYSVLHEGSLSSSEQAIAVNLLCRVIQIECIPEICFSLYNYHSLADSVKDTSLFGDEDDAFQHIGTCLLALACSHREDFASTVEREERDLYDKIAIRTFLERNSFPTSNCLSWAIKEALDHRSDFTY